MPDDIVTGFIRRTKAEHPEIAESAWLRLEVRLRQEWGGERHYVQKAPTLGKAYSLAERLAAGESPREAFRNSGLTRTTGYRVLSWKGG